MKTWRTSDLNWIWLIWLGLTIESNWIIDYNCKMCSSLSSQPGIYLLLCWTPINLVSCAVLASSSHYIVGRGTFNITLLIPRPHNVWNNSLIKERLIYASAPPCIRLLGKGCHRVQLIPFLKCCHNCSTVLCDCGSCLQSMSILDMRNYISNNTTIWNKNNLKCICVQQWLIITH